MYKKKFIPKGQRIETSWTFAFHQQYGGKFQEFCTIMISTCFLGALFIPQKTNLCYIYLPRLQYAQVENSSVAQRKRVGLITQRSVDRNYLELIFAFLTPILCCPFFSVYFAIVRIKKDQVLIKLWPFENCVRPLTG